MKYNAKGTISYTVYIPQDMLSKNGATVQLPSGLDVYAASSENDFVGYLSSRYEFTIENVDGSLAYYYWDNQKNKEVKSASVKKMLSVKKAGKYYKVTVKNSTFDNKLWGENGKSTKAKKTLGSKKYLMNPSIHVTAAPGKKISGEYMYFDDITIKHGSSITYNFSKKNYDWLWGSSSGKDVKAKVVKLNTSKVK